MGKEIKMSKDDCVIACEFYDWKEDRKIVRTETMKEAVEDWIESNMNGVGDDAARKFVIENCPVTIYGFSHPKVDIDALINSAVDDVVYGWLDDYGDPDDEFTERNLRMELGNALHACVLGILKSHDVFRLEMNEKIELSAEDVLKMLEIEATKEEHNA